MIYKHLEDFDNEEEYEEYQGELANELEDEYMDKEYMEGIEK